MVFAQATRRLHGAKPFVQGLRQSVNLRFDIRIRKEREEIAGRAAAFSRPKLSPTIEVENELHRRTIEQIKNKTSHTLPSENRKAASRRDSPARA